MRKNFWWALQHFCWSSALLTLGQLVRNNGTSRGACHDSKSRICAATLFCAEWIYLDNNISLSQQQAESRVTIIVWIVRRRGNWRRAPSPLPLFSLLSSLSGIIGFIGKEERIPGGLDGRRGTLDFSWNESPSFFDLSSSERTQNKWLII